MARIGIALRWLLLGAIGAFLLTTTAQADCLGFWDLNGTWQIRQLNGFIATFQIEQQGKKIGGSAQCCRCDKAYDCANQLADLTGNLEGSISGDTFTMVAHWNNGPGGEYAGQVNPQTGEIGGVTRDLSNPGAEKAAWYGDHAAIPCTVKTPPSQAETPASPLDEAGVLKNRPGIGDLSTQTKPTPPPAGGNPTATVIANVDVYKQAGGEDKDKIGILYSNKKTTKVSLVAPCQDNWCHVKGDLVPTGEGWVYSGTPPDFQSLQF